MTCSRQLLLQQTPACNTYTRYAMIMNLWPAARIMTTLTASSEQKLIAYSWVSSPLEYMSNRSKSVTAQSEDQFYECNPPSAAITRRITGSHKQQGNALRLATTAAEIDRILSQDNQSYARIMATSSAFTPAESPLHRPSQHCTIEQVSTAICCMYRVVLDVWALCKKVEDHTQTQHKGS